MSLWKGCTRIGTILSESNSSAEPDALGLHPSETAAWAYAQPVKVQAGHRQRRTPPPPASIPAYKDLSHDFSWKPEITKSFTEAGNKPRGPDDRRQKITAGFASSIFIGLRCRCRQIALQPGCRSGKQRQDWNLSCAEIRAGSFNCTGFAGEENSGTAFSWGTMSYTFNASI